MDKNGQELKMPPDSSPVIEHRGPMRGWREKRCDIIKLNEKERNLIEYLRQVAYGEVIIFMQDNEPVRIEKVKESVKL